MRAWRVQLLFLTLVGALGCDGGGPTPPADGGPVLPPGEGCNSVRLTNYDATSTLHWCEFPTDLPMLPAFVRSEGMTAAIAEPYNGGFYGGDPGEACGECWEIDTITDTRIVMITNLCPNAGNPLCQGAHFHLDISQQASSVLNAGFVDEAQARRVPCPVEGNVHVLVNDENFSYLRLAFVNQRIPIRSASVRSTTAGSPEIPLSRSGGAWEAISDEPLDRGGEGVTFTLTSAQGQTVTSTVVVPTHPARGTTFDLGVQFDDMDPPTGGACVFQPPGVVFDDDFGGIDLVRWQIDPWGEAEGGFFGRVEDGCFDGACLRVEALGQFSGFHIRYNQAFPTSTFSRLVFRVHASASSELVLAASHMGDRCEQQRIMVGPEWTEVTYDVSASCGALPNLNAMTIDNPGERIVLTLDDVRFE